MSLFDPSRGPPAVPHPGSYNANPVSLAAGLATLELLTRDVIAQLNRRGDRLRKELKRAFAEAGVPAAITGLGSLFGIHTSHGPVRTVRDASRADADLRHRLFLGLYNEGVLVDPRGVGTVSTATGEAEIDRFLEAVRTVLARLTNNAGEAQLREIDSEGYLLQGSYRFGKNRVALSYGKTEDDGNGLGTAADYETRGIALFHDINDNLKLVAELNQVEVEGQVDPSIDEETRTFAIGATLSF
jgi:hypothetical protein